jgi:hypothetical protein
MPDNDSEPIIDLTSGSTSESYSVHRAIQDYSDVLHSLNVLSVAPMPEAPSEDGIIHGPGDLPTEWVASREARHRSARLDDYIVPEIPENATSFNEMNPHLPSDVTNAEDAECMGYSLDPRECNCPQCVRVRSGRIVTIWIDDPSKAKFKFTQPMLLGFEDGPKGDPRLWCRPHNVLWVKQFSDRAIRMACHTVNEFVVKNCDSCGKSLISAVRSDNNRFGNYSIWALPENKTLCQTCFSESSKLFLCDCCERVLPFTNEDGVEQYQDISHHSGLNKYICQTCADEEYGWCCACEHLFRNDSLSLVEDDYYCASCFDDNFVHCEDCESGQRRSNCSRTHEGWVCQSCFEDDWELCNECDRAVRSDHGSSNDEDEFVCNACQESGIQDIHGHSYRPRPKFRLSRGERVMDNQCFGFELEVENIQNRVTIDQLVSWTHDYWEARGHSEFIYAKTDGSLSYGVELVSHPFSWAWYMEHRGLLLGWIAGIRGKGFRSFDTDTCGLHIHMNKDAFRGPRLYKWMKFFHENGNFIYEMSGRKNRHELDQWAAIDNDGQNKRNLIQEARTKFKPKGGKYWAVNLENEHTIEIRMFKGTLGSIQFTRAFEFLRAMYIFCEDRRYPISQITLPKFLEYMKADESELYDNLKKKLARIKTRTRGLTRRRYNDEGIDITPDISDENDEGDQ